MALLKSITAPCLMFANMIQGIVSTCMFAAMWGGSTAKAVVMWGDGTADIKETPTVAHVLFQGTLSCASNVHSAAHNLKHKACSATHK